MLHFHLGSSPLMWTGDVAWRAWDREWTGPRHGVARGGAAFTFAVSVSSVCFAARCSQAVTSCPISVA